MHRYSTQYRHTIDIFDRYITVFSIYKYEVNRSFFFFYEMHISDIIRLNNLIVQVICRFSHLNGNIIIVFHSDIFH